MGAFALATYSLATYSLVALIASPAKSEIDTQSRIDAGAYLGALAADRLGDRAAAADFYADATEADQSDQNLVERAFIADLHEGSLDRAIERAEILQAMESRQPLVNVVLALRAAKQGDWQEAGKIVTEFEERGANRLLAPMAQAWIAAGGGKPDVADLILENAPEGAPILFGYHDSLIEALTGDEKLAAAQMATLLEQDDNPPIRLVMTAGAMMERSGDAKTALEWYRKLDNQRGPHPMIDAAIARAESGSSTPGLPVASALDGLAQALFDVSSGISTEGASQAAVIFLQMAGYIRPLTDEEMVLLGRLMNQQRRYQDAVAAFSRVPDGSAFSREARLGSVSSYTRLEQTEAAEKTLMDLAALYPDDPIPASELGDLYRAEKRYDDSINWYNTALQIYGGDADWTLFYVLGIAYERNKQWTLAEKSFEKALDLEPGQPSVMNYLAYSWTEQGVNLDVAHAMIANAVAARPNDGYIVDSLGWVYFKMGDFDKAVEHLERATALRPHDPIINDHLGDAYWHAGRKREAFFQWERALKLDPEEELAVVLNRKVEEGYVSQD